MRDPQWVAKVDAAQAVYFSGGNQARLIDTLRLGGNSSPLREGEDIDRGFEWPLALTPDSTAYLLRPQRFTIGEIELDIVPVLMQRPLYTPYRP